MEIDHIFIFSNNKGKEANDLVNFGFMEGSNRLHPGQGTINRKFYFENFNLEILWVIDEKEIQSDITSVTKLWERSQFRHNGNSRFGLCLVNSDETDSVFAESEIYQPNYLPKRKSIDIITNNLNPKLPWTFRLPQRNGKTKTDEPINHSNGIKKLTKAEFGIVKLKDNNQFTSLFKQESNISFNYSLESHLTLEFDSKTRGRSKIFPELGLTIKY